MLAAKLSLGIFGGGSNVSSFVKFSETFSAWMENKKINFSYVHAVSDILKKTLLPSL